MRQILGLVFALFVLVAPAMAKFDEGLINISWGNAELQPTGKAVLGADNDKWNALEGEKGDKDTLTNQKGDKTEATVTFAAAGTYDAATDGGFVGTKWENLLRKYLHTRAVSTVTLAGLTPGAKYDLVVFSASDADGRKTKFTSGKDTATTTYKKDTKDLEDGNNYAKFTVTADDTGKIEFTFEGVDDGEGNLNGLQLAPAAK